MIDVSYENGILTIRADMNEQASTQKDNYVVNERRMGRVYRSFLVSGVKEDRITAEYKDGVLKVVLPKR